ncbi:MAG: hypothetical protein HF975_08375 [ANME-2 cluster archaeon]|nr:hypothetical protein [ANME-2 cluster archaeon]
MLPDNHSTHRMEKAKKQGANKLLTNCTPCPLFLEQGLELMREPGEPMECGIFDFYKVFSRAFGEGRMRQEGLEWEVGDVAPPIPHGKERGCQQALTNCPSCILFLEQGLELVRE